MNKYKDIYWIEHYFCQQFKSINGVAERSMPDATTSPSRAGQFAGDAAQGDRQDDLSGGAGCVKQQADAGADDPRGLRRPPGSRP